MAARAKKKPKKKAKRKERKRKSKRKRKRKQRRRRGSSSSSDDSSSGPEEDRRSPAKKIELREQFKHARAVGAITSEGTLSLEAADLNLLSRGPPDKMERRMRKGLYDMPFGEIGKSDGKGYRTEAERAAKIVHGGEVVDLQSRKLLPFVRWTRALRRFQCSYVRIHLHSTAAEHEMDRYEAQLMSISERYAHHPQGDLCVAMVD